MVRPDKIEFKTIQAVDKADFIRLYKAAGWWKAEYDADTGFIAPLVTGSTCFVGAFVEKRMIGMGRAISDGVSDAYIHDIVVLNQYRNLGIGRGIVQRIVRHLRDKGIDWIGLVGKPGTQQFYKDLGFEVLKDHISMRYKMTGA